MMLFLYILFGTVIQPFDWSNSMTTEEKYITLCVYRTGSVYFGEDRIMSCIKQGGAIRLTHEVYDTSFYDNDGNCMLQHNKSCHIQHSYRYSDTRILNLIEDCYGQRECRPVIPKSYWDYPYRLFQKSQNCSYIEKHKIGIKIFYKCTDGLGILKESTVTSDTKSDNGSTEEFTGNSFVTYTVVAVVVALFILVAIIIAVVLYKRRYNKARQRGNPYVRYISEQY